MFSRFASARLYSAVHTPINRFIILTRYTRQISSFSSLSNSPLSNHINYHVNTNIAPITPIRHPLLLQIGISSSIRCYTSLSSIRPIHPSIVSYNPVHVQYRYNSQFLKQQQNEMFWMKVRGYGIIIFAIMGGISIIYFLFKFIITFISMFFWFIIAYLLLRYLQRTRPSTLPTFLQTFSISSFLIRLINRIFSNSTRTTPFTTMTPKSSHTAYPISEESRIQQLPPQLVTTVYNLMRSMMHFIVGSGFLDSTRQLAVAYNVIDNNARIVLREHSHIFEPYLGYRINLSVRPDGLQRDEDITETDQSTVKEFQFLSKSSPIDATLTLRFTYTLPIGGTRGTGMLHCKFSKTLTRSEMNEIEKIQSLDDVRLMRITGIRFEQVKLIMDDDLRTIDLTSAFQSQPPTRSYETHHPNVQDAEYQEIKK